MNNTPNALVYFIGIFAGLFAGVFTMYMGYVNDNLLLSKHNYICVDAEPTDNDPSIVACTIVLRKGSHAYNQYLELANDRTN